MTSRNMNLKIKHDMDRIPYLLKPVGKDYLWGGSRLNDDFSKGIDMQPLAETWECSTHPDGMSRIMNGRFAGQTLKGMLDAYPEYMGTHPDKIGELPILIKFIDAKQNLSVQVHPDDAFAKVHERGSRGKSEMWYVLDACKDTEIIYGFWHDVSKEELEYSLRNGVIEKHLQRIKIKKDDVFYVEAGTVHAIGAGALIAEVQESSNITYRLYDYGRLGKDGSRRELHIGRGMQVINRKAGMEPRQPLRVLKYSPGCALELLCRCRYFQAERFLVNTERQRNMVDFKTGKNTFQVLLCLSGCGVFRWDDSEYLDIFKGDCFFIPADSADIKIHGKMQFLKIGC